MVGTGSKTVAMPQATGSKTVHHAPPPNEQTVLDDCWIVPEGTKNERKKGPRFCSLVACGDERTRERQENHGNDKGTARPTLTFLRLDLGGFEWAGCWWFGTFPSQLLRGALIGSNDVRSSDSRPSDVQFVPECRKIALVR